MENLKFLNQMKKILFDDYDKFLNCLEKDAIKGIRINNLLVSDICKLINKLPFKVQQLNFLDSGFKLSEIYNGIGKLILHHAGAFYVQEPSAMVPVCALDPKPGDRVLDLCAAPGGKSTQIASMLNNRGLLFANEINKSRCNILISNLERMGVKNSIVFSKKPVDLCNYYCDYFDRVLVDAPCSGEGMFRKNSDAILNWSIENTKGCSFRQKEILELAAKTVRPGGTLVYSTCTFSTVENEEVIKWFLDKHDDFKLEPINICFGEKSKFDSIISNASYMRRIYPFHGGEGQFVAKLKREGNSKIDFRKSINYSRVKSFSQFWEQTFDEPIPKIVNVNDRIMIVPDNMPKIKDFLVAGIFAGRLKNDRFVPNHHLFKCKMKIKQNKLLDLSLLDKETLKFIKGEEINTNCKGYCGVRVDGIPLGFGKASNGKLKNHYPKGLRLM